MFDKKLADYTATDAAKLFLIIVVGFALGIGLLVLICWLFL